MNATFRPGGGLPVVTRLRLGRLLALVLIVGGVLIGGTVWLLGNAKPTMSAALTDSAA